MNITVRFNDVTEFVEELGKGKPADGIVRVTKSFHSSNTLPIRHVSVIASFVRDKGFALEIVRIERPIGQLMGDHRDSMSEKVLNRADEVIAEIEKAATALNLEVRAGVNE